MSKITFIGAGSFVIARKLLGDIFSYPDLRESKIVLMDIDPKRLELITQWAKNVISRNKFPTCLISTLNQKEALRGTDFVLFMFDVGELESSVNVHLN